MAAKMLAFAKTGQIVVGKSLYEKLPSDGQKFEKLDIDPSRWSYLDEKGGSPYGLYVIK